MTEAAHALPDPSTTGTNNPFAQPVRTAPPSPAAPDPGSLSKPPPPRTGAIPDSAYHGLPADQQSKYANVKKPGIQGGSEWILRDQLATESGLNTPAIGADEKVKIGDAG